ncbi:helix-turn-helix domain-containing protein [Saccharopolyspora elongata]|uniref:Response regulatory domain-containing protein n=1 Tax=Saccharopolyspora elongata TaxID=2530387 RepID=A0A4R4YY89_9PSEU|nr:hypothetical protein [Saccharopolyspora elongata]TDD50386.1 hypothetical protein E1288_17765 [Saccharopolyspora elongata]
MAATACRDRPWAPGLKLLLSSVGIEVTAVVAEAEPFLDLIEAEAPDAAVVDVRLPPSFRDEGVRAALRARRVLAYLGG